MSAQETEDWIVGLDSALAASGKRVSFRIPHCTCYQSGMVMHYDEQLKRYCCPVCQQPAHQPTKETVECVGSVWVVRPKDTNL